MSIQVKVVAARAIWMQKLQKRTKAETDWFGGGSSYWKDSANSLNESFDHAPYDDARGNMSLCKFAFEPATSSVTMEFVADKHPVASTEMQIVACYQRGLSNEGER